MTPTIVKNIIISEKDPLTKVDAPSFPVKAIIVNHGDHAYAKVIYTRFQTILREDLCGAIFGTL
jgi:hypothetical protein